MANADQHTGHGCRDPRSSPAADRCRGQNTLAEVIMIRPERSNRSGFIGSLIAMARVIASPRTQATLARTPPRSPSSPAPLSLLQPRVPRDAA
jgi:hypothetical protein